MHKNLHSDTSIDKTDESAVVDAPATKSAPVVLDPTMLKKVAGGLSPNGTWAVVATPDSPNGTW